MNLAADRRMARRARAAPRALALALAAAALAFALGSCASIERHYMDNLDAKYSTIRKLSQSMPPAYGVHVKKYEDITIPGPAGPIPARVYIPLEKRADAPLILYFHGGGFVIGSYRHVDRVTRSLASRGGGVVVSIDYALAPERPYPAGLEDCEAAFEWLAARAAEYGGSPDRIVLAGESAGGNLSAVLSQKRRDEGKGMPLAQLLFSPAIGLRDPATGKPWPSRKENARKSILTPKSLVDFGKFYLGDPERYADEPYVNPIAARSLAGLPPALVVSCEYDPLRDEGEAYARALEAAGVPVTAKRFDRRDHAYQGKEVLDLAVEFLEKL
jgi:acetyl esterase